MVGSGAGGAIAAMVLAEAGYDVVVLEKGDNRFDDVTQAAPRSRFSSDELKARRHFAKPEILRRAGADHVTAVPDSTSAATPLAGNDVPTTAHVMGGMRMGTHPAVSATDNMGRFHQLDNLFVADGSVFPTSGAHNPTLTIMATALRNARRWVG